MSLIGSPMTVADLDAVMAIEVSAYGHPWTHGNFVDSLAAGYLACIARSELARCVGYYVAMPAVDEMHLLNLTVAPALQRCGHGRHLLQVLCGQCQARGLSRMLLEVRQSNTVARRLYARFGFDDIGLRPGYYPGAAGRREDAVVMRLTMEDRAHALD